MGFTAKLVAQPGAPARRPAVTFGTRSDAPTERLTYSGGDK